MNTYKKEYTSELEYIINEYRVDGRIREVSEQHQGYIDYVNSGNIVDVIAYVGPTPEEELQILKDSKITDIINTRNGKFMSGITYDGNLFDSSPESLTNINGAFSVATNDSNYTTDWILKDESIISLSNDDIIALGVLAANFKGNLILNAGDLRNQVNLLDDHQDVIDFNVNQGW